MHIKRIIEKIAKCDLNYKILINFVKWQNGRLKNKIGKSYSCLWRLESFFGRRPYSFNHEIDIYFRLKNDGNFHWGEIASFNVKAIHMYESPYVLELGCGDGFYADYFYKWIPNLKYVGCDLDELGISDARERLKEVSNFSFISGDFLKNMPLDNCALTNVIMCETINMFSKEEQEEIIDGVAERLREKKGIFSGTAVLYDKKNPQWEYYIGLYEEPKELRELLETRFSNVLLYTRKNMPDNAIFFMASDGSLPFYNKEGDL